MGIHRSGYNDGACKLFVCYKDNQKLMSAYKKTVVSVMVSMGEGSPLYAEGATKITLEDEAGGGFLVLTQDDMSNGLRLDLDELEFIYNVGKQMVEEYNKQIDSV